MLAKDLTSLALVRALVLYNQSGKFLQRKSDC